MQYTQYLIEGGIQGYIHHFTILQVAFHHLYYLRRARYSKDSNIVYANIQWTTCEHHKVKWNSFIYYVDINKLTMFSISPYQENHIKIMSCYVNMLC